jgi:acyl dehydratase
VAARHARGQKVMLRGVWGSRADVGAGVDELRWPLPVRPGDELYIEVEVLEVRQSRSRPSQGLIKVRTTTRNQKGEAVQTFIGNLVVPRRGVSLS